MRTEFDLSPLLRFTVGFDRMLDALRSAARVEQLESSYPPYDIERAGEDEYRLTLAVAGFRPEKLTVTTQPNLLVVSGERREPESASQGNRQLLHRGIAARSFERRFNLADHVEVVSANLADGLLTITLRRDVPEAMRPRCIDIGRRWPASPPQIEGEALEERKAA